MRRLAGVVSGFLKYLGQLAKIKDRTIDWSYIADRETRNELEICWENLMENVHLEDQKEYGMVTLK
jgi:hypothetical protein